MTNPYLDIHPDVAQVIAQRRPVVALVARRRQQP